MKTIDAIWFTTVGGTVGIVVGEDEVTRNRKAYIGVVSGLCEEVDTEHIRQFGSPVSLSIMRKIVKLMEEKGTG